MSPEYETLVRRWGHRFLDFFEMWLNPDLPAVEAEQLRQRAIGYHMSIMSVDDELAVAAQMAQQTTAAQRERMDITAMEGIALEEQLASKVAYDDENPTGYHDD